MVDRIVAPGQTGEGSWLALHRDSDNGDCAPRGISVDFHFICVSRLAGRAFRSGSHDVHLQQKLLFAAWRVHGSPTEIRKRYRKRFGVETSYRQMRQARIYTCTRNPRLRLFFIAVALMLRNIWVWVHQTRLAEDRGNRLIPHLELLRFKQMLAWIEYEIVALLHDRQTTYVIQPP